MSSLKKKLSCIPCIVSIVATFASMVFIITNKENDFQDKNNKNDINTKLMYDAYDFRRKKTTELENITYDEIANLPKFDGREYDYMTWKIESQKDLNLCWAFSTVAASELSIVRNGLAPIRSDPNFSERQVDYITTHRDGKADHLGLTLDDKFDYSRNEGNWPSSAAKALLQWNGPLLSSVDPTKETSSTYEQYTKSDWILTDYLEIRENNPEKRKKAIKKAISQFGATTVSYDYTGLFNGKTTYLNAFVPISKSFPHSSTIVGWDDTISRQKFKEQKGEKRIPNEDGAWIVRNSWGSDNHEFGYFYLSYDSQISDIVAFNYGLSSEYDNNYYYDGMIEKREPWTITPFELMDKEIAVIFQAKKANSKVDELLKAINVDIRGNNTILNYKIYKNVKADFNDRFSSDNEPDSGKLVYSGNVSFEYEGANTIIFPMPIRLVEGDNFAVVVKVRNTIQNSSILSDAGISVSKEPNSRNDMSFCLMNGKWTNTTKYENSVARIKAFTKEIASSVNTSSSTDNKITNPGVIKQEELMPSILPSYIENKPVSTTESKIEYEQPQNDKISPNLDPSIIKKQNPDFSTSHPTTLDKHRQPYNIRFSDRNEFNVGFKTKSPTSVEFDNEWIKNKIITNRNVVFNIGGNIDNFDWKENITISEKSIDKPNGSISFKVIVNNSNGSDKSTISKVIKFTGFKENRTKLIEEVSRISSLRLNGEINGEKIKTIDKSNALESIGIILNNEEFNYEVIDIKNDKKTITITIEISLKNNPSEKELMDLFLKYKVEDRSIIGEPIKISLIVIGIVSLMTIIILSFLLIVKKRKNKHNS